MSDEPKPIPPMALLLTAAGALPFIGLAAIAVAGGPLPTHAQGALLTYGAVILSFMGGIHWGFALTPLVRAAPSHRLLLGVIPALIGWTATLLPQNIGLCLLALAFAVLPGLDLAAIRTGAAPSWYGRLRVPVTVVVVAALLAASVAS
ncbi:MAG: DUF3429 domain-containing protein [Alphaproteobacteria bacterium]|nr:DUF3429 domain-containing protein [Alphaproteobacteria bacterium]